MSGIFISYRRSDNPDATGRIYDRLVSEFGKARVFKDVDSIPLGQDFRGHLNDVVGKCAAVLTIIGPRWSDIRNEAGQRRLEDPDDFVRIELEAALARNIPVVPVLVGHASLPGTGELPPSLVSLAYRQSIQVRPDPDFHNDATRLVSALQLILDPDAPRGATRQNPRQFWLAAVAAAALAAAAAFAYPAWKFFHQTPPPETRTDIATAATDQPRDFALSPDGRQIVFAARGDGASQLWLRSLASTTAQPLPGTEGATEPFWSPDGRSIGFFASDTLKRLDLGGGQPRNLAIAPDHGGAWGPDGTILFRNVQLDSLMRIAATGGPATQVLKATPQFSNFFFPRFLPGGRFLVAAFFGTAPGIYLGRLDGSPPVRLASDLSPAFYLPSGWLLWVRNGALVAQRLDLGKGVLTGPLTSVADRVDGLSVSATGPVAYRIATTRLRQELWVNRSGTRLGTIGDPDASWFAPRVSPDGHSVALSRASQDNFDIWQLDGARISRLTSDASADTYPVWSPDGTRVVFVSSRSGPGDLYQKRIDGAGPEERLLASDQRMIPTSWSADGRFLLYFSLDPTTGIDLWVLPMTGDRKPFVFLKTAFSELWGQFSPDGKWVAYDSNESGRDEVYVRPFVPPGGTEDHSRVAGGRLQVSTAGGAFPVWSADGRELYFVNPEGGMMATAISATGPGIQSGAPVLLFQTRVFNGGVDRQQGRQYDVARDGRFLINTELDAGTTPPITLIQNWNPAAGGQ